MKSLKTLLGAGLLGLSGLAMVALSPTAAAADNRFTITYRYGDIDHHRAPVVYYRPAPVAHYRQHHKWRKHHRRLHRQAPPWFARPGIGSHYRDYEHYLRHHSGPPVVAWTERDRHDGRRDHRDDDRRR